jgi:hypothetical protein
MTKLEAIIQPTKFDMVKEALIALGVDMDGRKVIPKPIAAMNTKLISCRRSKSKWC